jgi:hypothetical protein
VTLDQHEEVRADATHFLLVPGHELEEVERVVNGPTSAFAVVEKFDRIIARTVRRLDPRAQPRLLEEAHSKEMNRASAKSE